MSLKKCEKCGEQVDEAKAFCPECGNPFVYEEKRVEATEFEKQAGTIAYSKTVFNLMLSKLNLDPSQPPGEEKIQPSPVEEKIQPQLQEASDKFSPQEKTSEKKTNSGIIKWIILAAVGLIILSFFLLAVLVVLYFYFFRPV